MARLKPPKRVVLNNKQAHTVLKWVFGKVTIKESELTKEDCGYAQALLTDMLNASFAMGFIESLFKSAAKIPAGPKKVITKFLTGAGGLLIKYKDIDDVNEMLADGKIYKSILTTAKSKNRSVWQTREMTGDLMY